MYRLFKSQITNEISAILRTNEDGSITSFGLNPDNTDYQTFKKEVLAGAELQDADGNVMTDANAFIATLP